jgi:hypothetical protein
MRYPVKTGILKHRSAILEDIASQLLQNSNTYSSLTSNEALNSSRGVDSSAASSDADRPASSSVSSLDGRSAGGTSSASNNNNGGSSGSGSDVKKPAVGLLNNDKYRSSDMWDRIRNLNYGFLKVENLYAMLYLRDLLRRKAQLDVSVACTYHT